MTATLSTETARFVGRCPNCGTGIATETLNYGSKAICSNCATQVSLHKVVGVFNDSVSCDSRCEYAVGPICSCACGGDNHSIGYVNWTTVPVWVTKRDAERFLAGKDRKAARARLSKDAKEAALAANIEVAISENPGLEVLLGEDLYETYGYFVSDVARRFRTDGVLSDKQISSVLAAVEKIDAEKAAQIVRDAKIASGEIKVAPVGKVAVTGVVVGFWEQESYFGYNKTTTTKAIIETAEGWKVSVTKPAKFELVKGDKISFNVTLKASNDPFFAYGTYLSNIVVR